MPVPEADSNTCGKLQVTGKFLKQIGVTEYIAYVHDYGGPVGTRLATASPKSVKGLIIQVGPELWRASSQGSFKGCSLGCF